MRGGREGGKGECGPGCEHSWWAEAVSAGLSVPPHRAQRQPTPTALLASLLTDPLLKPHPPMENFNKKLGC